MRFLHFGKDQSGKKRKKQEDSDQKELSCWAVVVWLLSRVQLFATPWTVACQPPLSSTISWSLLTESVMPSNQLILCHPLLLLPQGWLQQNKWPRKETRRRHTSGGNLGARKNWTNSRNTEMVKWSDFDNCVVAEGKQRRLDKTDSQIYSGNEECLHNDPIPEILKEMAVVWSTFITQLNHIDGGIQ